MNRTAAIAIGVVVILVVSLVGVILIPVLLPKTQMTVTFYDSDGNVVWTEKTEPGLLDMFTFAFSNSEGAEVASMVVKTDFVVTDKEAGSDLITHCWFDVSVYLNTYGGSAAGSASASTAAGSFAVLTSETGTFQYTFYFDDFIGVESVGKEYGWGLFIDAALQSTQFEAGTNTQIGEPAGWDESISVALSWIEPEVPGAEFAVGGTLYTEGV